MLNLNLNIIECQRRAIKPILANTFFYTIVGGGGGGSAGDGGNGGKGGQGGEVITGSFSVNHLSTFNLSIGNGGAGGTPISGKGGNGSASSITYQSATVASANGGLGDFNASQVTRGGTAISVPFINPTYSAPNSLLFGQLGTAGGPTPVGVAGIGGGTDNQFGPPWSTSPTPTGLNALANLGGGGGGQRWDQFPGGAGAEGICIVSFYDPNDFYDYTGDWDYFFYEGGYKYFWYVDNGSFTLLGKKSST